MLRWGVLQENVPISVVETLKCVPPLQKGQTTARETVPRKDVSNEAVEATLPFLKPVVAAMAQVQRLAVMRPCEVCRMKVADIDMSRNDGIWLYCPKEHKNAWRENEQVGEYARIIPLGKPEQELIAPLLQGKTTDQPVFPNKNGKHHSPNAYGDIVTRAIKKANIAGKNVPHWTPYQFPKHRSFDNMQDSPRITALFSVAHVIYHVYCRNPVKTAVRW